MITLEDAKNILLIVAGIIAMIYAAPFIFGLLVAAAIAIIAEIFD